MESKRRNMAIRFRRALYMSLLSTALWSNPTLAAITLNTPFPGSDNINNLGEYIAAFYRFFISALAVMAVVVIMFAGFRWMTASGNQERISKAKESIIGAIVGVVLALTSWVILNLIDPNLINLSLPNVTEIRTGDVRSLEICPFGQSVQSQKTGGYTKLPKCGETYDNGTEDGQEAACRGWKYDNNEDACYFKADNITALVSESASYTNGIIVSQLSYDMLRRMNWPGGKHETPTIIDVDDEDQKCGLIKWDDNWGPLSNGEYKFTTHCDSHGGTQLRCVLREPLEFVDDGTDDDPGTGRVKGAKCWGGF